MKESFPKKDFSEIIDQLHYVPELSYQPRVTWEAVKLDLDAMKLISISSFEERIRKKPFKRKAGGFPVSHVQAVVDEILLAGLNVITENGTENGLARKSKPGLKSLHFLGLHPRARRLPKFFHTLGAGGENRI